MKSDREKDSCIVRSDPTDIVYVLYSTNTNPLASPETEIGRTCDFPAQTPGKKLILSSVPFGAAS
jgi:hypothetical protein